ncbi:DUF2306 domain-containing protein [Sphingomonas immobilis]|uniref:DUF2306 domain-containing protein n=1 Tax=Sphingomonas immobilis TaxID=3063997 RepID=A0ABT8ZVU5_9SPHN|nr:hypothetical protein [Sphingomonas sp. CA1-15]MDO7841693.1 hypothetical protein [Sphingomonas sp. CA1-15]
MATMADGAKRVKPLTPDLYEKLLSAGAIVLLAAVIVALAKGYPHWGQVPGIVWAHLVTILIALVLTPVMLLRPRGTRLHRQLGKIWVVAMFLTAAISFGVRGSSGQFSLIHILSVFVVVMAPLVWLSARQHNIVRHRRIVRGMVTGALLIAGFFTFPFGRMLGSWLFG